MNEAGGFTQDDEPFSSAAGSRELRLLSVGGHTQHLLTRRSAAETLRKRGQWKKKTCSCCMNNVSVDWTLRAAAVLLTRTVETDAWLRCAQSLTGANRERNNSKKSKVCMREGTKIALQTFVPSTNDAYNYFSSSASNGSCIINCFCFIYFFHVRLGSF